MIVKFFELDKKNFNKNNFFLFYGQNQGYIQEATEKLIKKRGSENIFNYDESDVLKDKNNFLENISNKSFFEKNKFIIISRSSDKLNGLIEEILEKNIDDITIVLRSEILDKKSKLRNLFEKNKNTICVAFYEDSNQTLNIFANNFCKEKNILISQQNINLIIDRSNGDRINLKNELNKIELFSKNKKKISSDDIIKLTNLSENYDVSDLINNALAQNQKRTNHILNENIFSNDETIMILKIFIIKLKRLLKIQKQIKLGNNPEEVISSFKPPIFWKEKDIVIKQIRLLSYEKLYELLLKINKIELIVKRYPSNSMNVILDLILQQVSHKN